MSHVTFTRLAHQRSSRGALASMGGVARPRRTPSPQTCRLPPPPTYTLYSTRPISFSPTTRTFASPTPPRRCAKRKTPGVYIFSQKDLRTFVFAFKLCLFKHLRSKMTPRRQLVLDFIKAYIRIHGIAPSYEVIAKGLKMRSKANIHRIVHRLQDDGYVLIKPHKFHSIKLVDRSVKEISAL